MNIRNAWLVCLYMYNGIHFYAQIIIYRFFTYTRMSGKNIFECIYSKIINVINRMGRGKAKIILSSVQIRDLIDTLNPLFLSIVIHKVIKIATRQKYYNSHL